MSLLDYLLCWLNRPKQPRCVLRVSSAEASGPSGAGERAHPGRNPRLAHVCAHCGKDCRP